MSQSLTLSLPGMTLTIFVRWLKICELILCTWGWLINLRSNMRVAVGKARELSLPKNKVNRKKIFLWMQFLKLSRRLNAISLLKNVFIFFLVKLWKQSFSLIFMYVYTRSISKNQKKDVLWILVRLPWASQAMEHWPWLSTQKVEVGKKSKKHFSLFSTKKWKVTPF